ncbi:MAG TPA: PGF-pre-PGF domain-containing protein [Methanosarcina sp.]|nr:PGF-pre-PGF domain-containing protein [Methanosarcina sp.]
MKRPEFKFVIILLLALTLFTVPASAGSAERTFPSSVSPDQEFKVTVNVADYGAAGQVLEKLPAGFTFVSSTLPERAVTVNGSEVSFLLMTEKSFSYTLKAPATTGTYKIVGLLRDINKSEFSVRPVDCSITVSQSSNSDPDPDEGSSGSSGGGGSGGGGGASAEPQSNVAAKELSKKSVNAGERVKFEFTQGATCIRYVEFDAKKSLGKVTTIVEMLKDQSKLVSGLPEGTVYKNVNIWVGSGGIANSNNIANAVVGFRVEKDWLEKCGADNTSVALWNYNNKAWSKLETKVVGGDNTYVFFESKTPGFGPFTIVVPSESKELKSSSSADTSSPTTENSKSSPAADAEKPSDKSSIPGFESVVAVGVIGAVYQILRRK